MPPKKRVADTSANEQQPSPKRARKPVAETAATTRPKRVSKAGNESTTVTTTATRKAKTAPANGADTPRKRGRPPKSRDSTTGASTKSTVPKLQEKPQKRRVRPPKKQQSVQAQSSSTGGTRGENEELPAKTEEDQKILEEHEDDTDEKDDGRSYWLMKAEPESRIVKGVDVKFSIDDLRAAETPEPWDGVRNIVARNNLRAMKKGDYAFFYHSNCKQPGVVGIMEIVREHSVDESAFDPAHPYYDEKSSRDNPKWEVVHVEFRRKFENMVPLETLKSYAKPGGPLENLQMLKQGRLSVSAVTPKEWRFIMKLAGESMEAEKPAEKATDGQDSQAQGKQVQGEEVQAQNDNKAEGHGDDTQAQGDDSAPGKADAEVQEEARNQAEATDAANDPEEKEKE